jgi:hypothetical protein
MINDEKFRYLRFKQAWEEWRKAGEAAGFSQKELEVWSKFAMLLGELARAFWKEEGELTGHL